MRFWPFCGHHYRHYATPNRFDFFHSCTRKWQSIRCCRIIGWNDLLHCCVIYIFIMKSYSKGTRKNKTRKPSCRWQTRATRKPAKNCSNSTCLQRCRWQYWHIFIRLAVAASEICEIGGKSLKIQTYGVQGHPRSSILVSIESLYTTSY